MVTIATHDGTFHCDEVVACMLLRELYSGSTIIRTRDEEKLQKATIVVDVGGRYDPSAGRFDHHQLEFTKRWPGCDITQLSSAGLVWLHYGKAILNQILFYNMPEKMDVNWLWENLYYDFFLPIDAHDNGVPSTLEKPKFVDKTCLVYSISRLNPTEKCTCRQKEACWTQALALAKKAYKKQYDALYSIYSGPYLSVMEAIDFRKQINPSGNAILIEQKGVNWERAIPYVAKSSKEFSDILYVIYQKESGWGIKAVSDPDKVAFTNRKSLPAHWGALSGERLDAAIGGNIKGAVFCHKNLFVAQHKTRPGILEMLQIALDAESDENFMKMAYAQIL